MNSIVRISNNCFLNHVRYIVLAVPLLVGLFVFMRGAIISEDHNGKKHKNEIRKAKRDMAIGASIVFAEAIIYFIFAL